MKKTIVMQQIFNPNGIGGVSSEYEALNQSLLTDEYEFIPLVLYDDHGGFNIRSILYYYREIKRIAPDIVQVRGAMLDGLSAEIAAKLAGNTKIMLCIHGLASDFVYYNGIKKWISKRVIEPLGYALADGISCVYQKCEHRENFKRFRNKLVHYVYNRMPDYSNYNKSEIRIKFRKLYNIPFDAKIGIFCGRLSPEKGIDYLVNALKMLENHWPESFYFIFVGEGTSLGKSQNDLKALVNQGNVIFTGCISNVSDLLFMSDFFILPSLHENHSIALLEALAANLPVIATNVGGNAESLENGKNGILIDACSEIKLHDAILKMLDDDVRKKYYRSINESSFEQFSNENVDYQLRLAYKAVLGEEDGYGNNIKNI